jgi:hypothetical protein
VEYDAWAYIPNLRRVRRISAEVKSDSLLGTDITIDDFDGFNDRVAFARLAAQLQTHFLNGGRTPSTWKVARFLRRVLTRAFRLPPERKPWMSEDARMAIFDAGFALTFLWNRNAQTDRLA